MCASFFIRTHVLEEGERSQRRSTPEIRRVVFNGGMGHRVAHQRNMHIPMKSHAHTHTPTCQVWLRCGIQRMVKHPPHAASLPQHANQHLIINRGPLLIGAYHILGEAHLAQVRQQLARATVMHLAHNGPFAWTRPPSCPSPSTRCFDGVGRHCLVTSHARTTWCKLPRIARTGGAQAVVR